MYTYVGENVFFMHKWEWHVMRPTDFTGCGGLQKVNWFYRLCRVREVKTAMNDSVYWVHQVTCTPGFPHWWISSPNVHKSLDELSRGLGTSLQCTPIPLTMTTWLSSDNREKGRPGRSTHVTLCTQTHTSCYMLPSNQPSGIWCCHATGHIIV